MRGCVLLLALGLAGCSGKPPAGYSFPGCGNAGPSSGCEDDDVLVCAQSSIAVQHAACTSDDECGLIPGTSIDCVALCPVAVRNDQAGAYQDLIANEAQRFCDAQADANQEVGCLPPVDCLSNPFDDGAEVAYCDAGTCAVGQGPDAGADGND